MGTSLSQFDRAYERAVDACWSVSISCCEENGLVSRAMHPEFNSPANGGVLTASHVNYWHGNPCLIEMMPQK
jgi:hypothetical protein